VSAYTHAPNTKPSHYSEPASRFTA
jgi:hypothetical protein